MHLSHLFEDLAAWYQTFDFQAGWTPRSGRDSMYPPRTQTVPQGPDDAQTGAEVGRDYARYRQIGHSGSRPARLAARPRHRRGRRHGLSEGHGRSAAGGLQHPRQPVLLDGRHGRADRFGDALARGSISWSSTRRATTSAAPGCDGRRPARRDQGSRSRPGASAAGSIRSSRTTHRQNFLVPPRVHRSFPLAELAGETVRETGS